MNINNSYQTNYFQYEHNALLKSPASHNDKDNKTQQLIVCNSAQHSTSVTNYNTPTNHLSPSASHKVLFTRINYKNKMQLGKRGCELPFIESKIGNGVSSSPSYKRFFSQRNSNSYNSNNCTLQNNVLNKYEDAQQRKYHFKKIGTSPEQIHRDIISSVKNIHHYKSKIPPIEVDDHTINANTNNDNCLHLHRLNNNHKSSVHEKAEQREFANEYNKKLIDKDIRHIILCERHKASEKINTLCKEHNTKQIVWSKPYNPIYLRKLKKAMFIRKNHPMLEINQIGTLPEMFGDGNFMNKLLNDGFSNVSKKFGTQQA